MPFTPYHFGPGGLLHALAPRRVSFLAFCAANVLIDIEPGWYMLTDDPPLHRFFHTVVGAVPVALATVLLYLALRRLAQHVRLPDTFGWQGLSTAPVIVGAVLGSGTHIALDSIMHADIRPLSPFSQANALYRWLTLSELHGACLLAGLAAGVVVFARDRLRKAGR